MRKQVKIMEPKINTSFKALLPNKYKDEKPEKVIATTYSLDFSEVYSMITDLLVKPENLYVFYDAKTAALSADFNSFVEIRNIIRYEGKKIFHPKIVLIKYNIDKKNHYVIFVTSKNITSQDQVNCYAAAYGSVDENNGNGEPVAELLSSLSKKRFEQEIDDLKKVRFQMDNAEFEGFLFGKNIPGVLYDLDNQNELVIISPFLKADALKGYPISKIYSNRDSFTEDAFFNGEIKCADKKTECYAFLNEHHEKIYMWKDGGKEHFIFGSSNATNGGLKNNVEFNIMFSASAEYKHYDSIYKSILSDKIICKCQQKKDSEEETLKNIMSKLKAKVNVNNNTDRPYVCELEMPADVKVGNSAGRLYVCKLEMPNDIICEIIIEIDNEETGKDDIDIKDNIITVKRKKPFCFITIELKKGIITLKNTVNLYPKWDNETKEKINEIIKKKNNAAMDEELRFGSKKRRTGDPHKSNYSRNGQGGSKQILKEYRYEFLRNRISSIDFSGQQKNEAKDEEKSKTKKDEAIIFLDYLRKIDTLSDESDEVWKKIIEKLIEKTEGRIKNNAADQVSKRWS